MKARNGRLAQRRIAIDGLQVHYRVSTSAIPAKRPPIVLVPGYGMSSRYMVPLAGRWRAISGYTRPICRASAGATSPSGRSIFRSLPTRWPRG